MDARQPLRGLVRGVDRGGRRHVYAVGGRPDGEVSGELGSLAGRPGEGRTPVWLTAAGRLTGTTPRASTRPSPQAVARWIGEPATWSRDAPAVRARAVGRRTLLSLRSLASHRGQTEAPAGEPAGWLVPESDSTLPLFEATHPITGDELLSTDPGEAERLGYQHKRLLGHLVAAAPVTGVLGVPKVDLGWALRRPGERSDPSPLGRGGIEQPAPGETVPREAFLIRGVALFEPGPVARVEIELNGRAAGNARIGLPRLDLAILPEHLEAAGAPVCGFEFPVTGPQMDPEAAEVRIDAVAVRTDGKRFPLPSRTFAREAARRGPADRSGRAAGLRERTADLIAATGEPAGEGLRVLAFAHRLDLGGAQRYFFELLKRLSADPAFSCAVVAPGTGPYTAAIEALGIPVHISAGLGAADPEAYEGRMLELAAWAAPQGFDLVWANSFDSAPGADLASRLQIPVVWSLHESFDVAHWWTAMYGAEDAYPYARERAEAALGDAGALVFAADATRRQYEPHSRPERMLTMPYGMELEEIAAFRRGFDRAAARTRLGFAKDTTVVLALGTFEPRKGQALIAQTFAAVAEDHPTAALLLVGDQPGDYSEGLHENVKRAGLGDRVHIEPLAADPYAWHALADLFVLASDIESSPIVVLEAMAFGTPVVATATFGVPELIEDGLNGYLCEPSDLDSLTATLDRALSASPERRRAVGEAGRLRVGERHDAGRYERRMRSLMTDLAGGGSPRPRRGSARRVSVLIPTLNAGEGFERSLAALQAQEGLEGLEILVADSGSSDDTVALARRAGAQVETVESAEFNHGAVRNLLAGRATGELLLTTVQDATLIEPTALGELAQLLEEDPDLAAVSATQAAGPGADLFSRWEAWLRPQAPGGGTEMDNVCAVIRRTAWEQLRFRELEFGEDLDFGMRAREAGWTTAWSSRPLVAHHHDRPAGHAFARAAIHRFQLARLVEDLDPSPVAAPGLEPLLAALPTVLGELQAALTRAVPEGSPMTLARCLRRVREALRAEPEAQAPEGELKLICEVCAVEGPLDGALPALRGELLASFGFPRLSQFALAQPEPVERHATAAFVARFAGSSLGEVIGDAVRGAPDSDAARRLWEAALRLRGEGSPRPTG